jgi:hypothetical protein
MYIAAGGVPNATGGSGAGTGARAWVLYPRAPPRLVLDTPRPAAR